MKEPTQRVSIRTRVQQLITTEEGFEISTQDLSKVAAGPPAYKIKVPLTHPNYNAHYSLLVAASFNGYFVDFVIQRLIIAQADLPYALVSATVKWTKWPESPNP